MRQGRCQPEVETRSATSTSERHGRRPWPDLDGPADPAGLRPLGLRGLEHALADAAVLVDADHQAGRARRRRRACDASPSRATPAPSRKHGSTDPQEQRDADRRHQDVGRDLRALRHLHHRPVARVLDDLAPALHEPPRWVTRLRAALLVVEGDREVRLVRGRRCASWQFSVESRCRRSDRGGFVEPAQAWPARVAEPGPVDRRTWRSSGAARAVRRGFATPSWQRRALHPVVVTSGTAVLPAARRNTHTSPRRTAPRVQTPGTRLSRRARPALQRGLRPRGQLPSASDGVVRCS